MKIILIAFLFLTLAFSAFAETIIKNYGSSSANKGGNSVANGGLIVTGDASANVSVKTEVNGAHAVTTVEATAEANGKKEEISKTFTGSGEVRVEVESKADWANATTTIQITEETSSSVETMEDKSEGQGNNNDKGKNIPISRIVPEQGGTQRIIRSILLALKNTFAYVVSFFF